MQLFLKKTINIHNYFSILLALLPISFIAGNLIINSNIILIILSSIIIFNKKLLDINFLLIDKLILIFFFFIIFTSAYNDFYFIKTDAYPAGYKTILKSISYFRFFLLYICLRFLIEKEIINLKLFFSSCLLSSLFVCFDIFYQLIFKKDIFGFEMYGEGRRLSGPFGDELIAGGYLSRFSIFSFFLIPLFYQNFQKIILKF